MSRSTPPISSYTQASMPSASDLPSSRPILVKTATTTIGPHPEALTTPSGDQVEASSCIVRCLTLLKNQIVSFFTWLCSCFSSEEKPAEKDKGNKQSSQT